MKKYSFLTFIFLVQFLHSQVTKKLEPFESVSVFDQLELVLVKGTENTIAISGTRASEVEVINNNGLLKLRMPFPKLLSGNDCKIVLQYTQIQAVNANEGAKISSKQALESKLLTLTTKEGAEILLDLKAEKLVLKAVTGGKLYLSGKTDYVDCSIFTGGIVEAQQIQSQEAIISVSAGGSATINASSYVDAKVRVGGSIFIHGKPKKINKQTTFGGIIEEMN